MKIGSAGLDLIKSFEGFRSQAYQDSVNVWTIGYGHTLGVQPGQVITQAQAEAFLVQDIAKVEAALNATGVTLAQNQFDSLCSLFFNVGTGFVKNFVPLLKANPNDPAIAAKIKLYCYAGGVKLAGLVRRRNAEAALYQKKNL